jgi:hypothetical protein
MCNIYNNIKNNIQTIIVYHNPYKYSSNPVHDVAYSIHNYVIKFVSVSILSGTPVSGFLHQ